MMTDRQVIDLLTAASVYDSRKPSQAAVTAWLEAANRIHWTFSEALDAIHTHYATTSEWLMPGHVTAVILRDRHQASAPSSRPVRETLDARNPDEVITTEADRASFLADIQGILNRRIDEDADAERGPVDPTDDGDACLTEPCPWCHAAIGNRCQTRGRPMRRRSCHPARKAAKVARLSAVSEP